MDYQFVRGYIVGVMQSLTSKLVHECQSVPFIPFCARSHGRSVLEGSIKSKPHPHPQPADPALAYVAPDTNTWRKGSICKANQGEEVVG